MNLENKEFDDKVAAKEIIVRKAGRPARSADSDLNAREAALAQRESDFQKRMADAENVKLRHHPEPEKRPQTDDEVQESKKAALREKILRQRQRDSEMVRGRFQYNEIPGGTMEFSFVKYKGDKVRKYSLVDGGIYTIPRGVMRHLNQNCCYPVHEHYSTEDNRGNLMRIGSVVHRCTFQSMEFMDDELDDRQVPLFTVERVAKPLII